MTKQRQIPIAVVGVLATTALASCAADGRQSTYEAGVMGANARVGAIQLLSVHIEAPSHPAYPAGADARIWLTLRNGARQPDTLTSVTSPVAQKAEIRWDDDCDGQYTTVDRLVLQPAVVAPSPQPSAASVFDAYRIRLVSLKRKVLAGTSVPVTFRFQHAGTVTVDAQVQPSIARPEPSTRCVPGRTS